MADEDEFLSDGDLARIEQLLEALDKSSVEFMKVDIGDLKITLGKGDARALADSPAPTQPSTTKAAKDASAPAARSAPETPASASTNTDGKIITAPMMGRFYAKPEPEAEPFVVVGSSVSADTTICLIEVMKTFTSVSAEVTGTILEVLVKDEEVVEFGQPLFRVSET